MMKVPRIDEKITGYEGRIAGAPEERGSRSVLDGQPDFGRLAELAGDAVATGPERYGLTWPGKREAIAMLQAPSRATSVPERGQSVNFDDARHVFIEGENLEVLNLL